MAETESDLWKIKREALDAFDFSRVAKTMKVLEWQWASGDTQDVNDLRKTADYLATNVITAAIERKTERYFSYATGGFEAVGNRWERADGSLSPLQLSIRFLAESSTRQIFN